LLAAGYHYDSHWSVLSVGLSPTRMAASFAAPDPYERLSRIRLPPGINDEEGCSSYTAPSLAHSISPRGVGRVLNETRFSLARALFSPGSAEDRSPLFVWFSDTMARSDSSRACVSALWLYAFADRPPSLAGRGAPEVSRFSCLLFLSVRGV